jgi:hypothetical protein
MKRISLIILIISSLLTGIIAQTVDDALRYSQVFYGGTARFMSMGGAFTALGADISSLSQNPAGLGVFRSSEFTITPQLFHINTSAGFNDKITSDYLYNFNLNQVGIVSNLISNSNETGLITLNLGYSFNKTNNLNQSMLIQGVGTTSSMADYWSGLASGYFTPLSNGFLKSELEMNVPDAWLARRAWIIDTLSGYSRDYGTVFSNYGDSPPSQYGQSIRRTVSYEGYTGEHAISIGGNYSNKIFFGATLGISKLKYTSHFQHVESTDLALDSKFENFTYTDHYENTGTGYSLKLGAIIKPVEAVRIGLAFHSPTWYRIYEKFYENITSNYTDGGHFEYSDGPYGYTYNLATPFRALAGIAVQIKKIAILSADYEFVDYSTARFKDIKGAEEPYDYTEKNTNIKQSLKSASNIRLGGEIRLNKLYLRTGYGYYGKAFKAGDANENLDYRSISFGAGFREQKVSIDFAYTNYKYSQTNVLYPLDDSFVPATVNLSTIKNMFTVTIGYKFGYRYF